MRTLGRLAVAVCGLGVLQTAALVSRIDAQQPARPDALPEAADGTVLIGPEQLRDFGGDLDPERIRRLVEAQRGGQPTQIEIVGGEAGGAIGDPNRTLREALQRRLDRVDETFGDSLRQPNLSPRHRELLESQKERLRGPLVERLRRLDAALSGGVVSDPAESDAMLTAEPQAAGEERSGAVSAAVTRSWRQAPLRIRVGREYLGPDYGQPREPTRFLLVELFLTHDAASESQPIALPLPQAKLRIGGTEYAMPSQPQRSVLSNSFTWFDQQHRLSELRSLMPLPPSADPPPDDTAPVGPPSDLLPAAPPEPPTIETDSPLPAAGPPGLDASDSPGASPRLPALAAGDTLRVVLLFERLPRTSEVPPLRLDWPGLSAPLDLNAIARERMRMTVGAAGPKNALGMLDIRGPVDTIAAGAIADEIAALEAAGTRRAIIAFRPRRDATAAEREAFGTLAPVAGGTVTDSSLLNWLANAAATVGEPNHNFPYFPQLPQGLLELQLQNEAGLLDAALEGVSYSIENGEVVHETRGEAIRAALADALSRISRQSALQLIRTSPDPAIRAAALVGVRQKLEPSDERFVMALATDSAERSVRLAAIDALGQMGGDAGLRLLLDLAASDEPSRGTDRTAALMALLGASGPARERALAKLPDEALFTPEALAILFAMADPQSPAASRMAGIFRRAFVEPPAVSDPSAESGKPSIFGRDVPQQEQVRADALQALATLDVPDLRDLLAEARDDPQPAVRRQVHRIVARSDDRLLRRAAIDDAIEELKSDPPSSETLDFLVALGDVRAAEAIARWVPSLPAGQATTAIRALRTLATQTQLDELATHYDDFDEPVRREFLTTLAARRSPLLIELARRELIGPAADGRLLPLVTSVLPANPTPEAAELLVEALDQEQSDSQASRLIASLTQMVDREAYDAAGRMLRDGGASPARQQMLFNLRDAYESRSPGVRFQIDAGRARESGDLRTAIALYGLALRHDPDLPSLLHNRGYAYMGSSEPDAYQLAIDDFDDAIAHGAAEAETWLMRAIAEITVGRVTTGLQTLGEAKSKPIRRDGLYIHLYNVACAYGRVRERLLAAGDPNVTVSDEVAALSDERRSKLLAKATTEAVETLRKSLQQVMEQPAERLRNLDHAHVASDPDLASLHDLPEWEELLAILPPPVESEQQ